MTKKEAIATFERAGYTFTGFKDIGWGAKYYHFTHPKIEGEITYSLSMVRKRAGHLDLKMWLDQRRAELEAGIQQELFSDIEIEEQYAIVN